LEETQDYPIWPPFVGALFGVFLAALSVWCIVRPEGPAAVMLLLSRLRKSAPCGGDKERRIQELEAIEQELLRQLTKASAAANMDQSKLGWKPQHFAPPVPSPPRTGKSRTIDEETPLSALLPKRAKMPPSPIQADSTLEFHCAHEGLVALGIPATPSGCAKYTLHEGSDTSLVEKSVGDLVQALPGAEFVDPNGVMHFQPGDVGTVITFRRTDDAKQARVSVLWVRTRQTSILSDQAWSSFQFIRTQKPKVGDLLQALPGIEGIEKTRMDLFEAGDVGTVIDFKREVGAAGATASFTILWARTEKVSVITPVSWMWFRFLLKQEPRVGDMLQALPGMDGEHFSEGDVGTVSSFFESDGTGEACFSIEWQRTGQVSSYTKAPWIVRFRLIPGH